MATLKQIVNRANTGHLIVLERLSTETGILTGTERAYEYQGTKKVVGTLREWECIGSGNCITDKGREVLAALTKKMRA